MDKTIEKMIFQAYQSLSAAYAPYSHFKVAACICSAKDNLYTGVNVENGSYGLSICAESSAICAMVLAGEQRIKNIVILASNNLLCSPCGACRQRMHEFSTKDTVVHLCNSSSILHTISMDKLLPLAFNFK